MKANIQLKKINAGLLQVANMNYGQMQRWKDFVPLTFEVEIELGKFCNAIAEYFSEFRKMEIEEDDTEGFPELVAYKKAGWLELHILAYKHPRVLEGIITYEQYDIMHHIVERPIPESNYYYSVNSLKEVYIKNKSITLKGICFKSDYIEHTFNHELPREYALLK